MARLPFMKKKTEIDEELPKVVILEEEQEEFKEDFDDSDENDIDDDFDNEYDDEDEEDKEVEELPVQVKEPKKRGRKKKNGNNVVNGTSPTPVKKPKEEKTTNNTRKVITDEDLDYIVENYSKKPNSEIAKELNISEGLLKRTVLKMRKTLLEMAKDQESYDKILNYVKTVFPRKRDGIPTKVKPKRANIDEKVNKLFEEIFSK